MEWLKVTDDGKVELVDEEIKLVPELQEMTTLAYNKQPGDKEGRNRYRLIQELRYMYLAYSLKGPYRDYSEKERLAQARIDCSFPEEWKESEQLIALIKKYTEANPNKTMRLLLTANKTLDKIREYLDAVDLKEKNKAGVLVNDPQTIMKTLKELPSVAQTIEELERQARTDTIRKVGTKGDHDLGWQGLTEQRNDTRPSAD